MHILETWKLQDIERKAEDALRRLHELDSLRSDVSRLEQANRELSSEADLAVSALNAMLDRVFDLETRVAGLEAHGGTE